MCVQSPRAPSTQPRLTQHKFQWPANAGITHHSITSLLFFRADQVPLPPARSFFDIPKQQPRLEMKKAKFKPGLAEKIEHGLRELHQIKLPDSQVRAHAIDHARCSKDWERLVFLHEPAEWLDVFEHHAAAMDDGTYWRVLLLIYCRLDIVAVHNKRFRRLFKLRPVEPALRIDPVYIHLFHAQPDQVKIYRGYAGPYSLGFSWTLSLRIAKFFAYRAQERLGDPQICPQIITGLAQKKDIVTLVLSGPEAEVIIDPTLVTNKKRRTLGPLRGSLEDLIA